LKVLMLNEVRDWGGGEVLTLDLARSLSRRDVDIVLGCNRNSILQKKADKSGVQTISFPMRSEMDIFAVIFIANLIKRDKFDIVHCHTMRDHVLGSLAAKYLGGIPVIRSQHIHYPENPSILAQLAYKKWTDVIICNSNYIKNNLEKVGIDPGLLTVIHNGIDLGRMDIKTDRELFSQEICLDGRESLIGCVGSLFRTKGQEYLIKAFPRVLEKFPGCRLVLVGDGPQREKLESLAGKLEIEGKVIFTGTRDDIPNILSCLDMMVIPSVWQEPFGLVNVEAMYSGIPLIATEVGGIPEIVENNITGITILPGREDLIAQAILRFLDDRDFARRVADNARKKVIEYFNADRMASETLQTYMKFFRSSPGY